MTTIHTIGHGNRPLEEFMARLREAGIGRLVDVRAFPGSRRHPHFARQALEKALPQAGMEYLWEGSALGGRRRPAPDSANTALRNASFRAYADHMMGAEYQAALARLIAHSNERGTAIMCAERLPWHCHRHLISDSLVARGVTVLHIVSEAPPRAQRPDNSWMMHGVPLRSQRGEAWCGGWPAAVGDHGGSLLRTLSPVRPGIDRRWTAWTWLPVEAVAPGEDISQGGQVVVGTGGADGEVGDAVGDVLFPDRQRLRERAAGRVGR